MDSFKSQIWQQQNPQLGILFGTFAGWREHIIQLQIIVQSYSNKYNMVLAQSRY